MNLSIDFSSRHEHECGGDGMNADGGFCAACGGLIIRGLRKTRTKDGEDGFSGFVRQFEEEPPKSMDIAGKRHSIDSAFEVTFEGFGKDSIEGAVVISDEAVFVLGFHVSDKIICEDESERHLSASNIPRIHIVVIGNEIATDEDGFIVF